MSRGRTVLLVLLGAGAVLVSAMLVWVAGRTQDVAGATATAATGAQASAGLVPLALVAAAGGFALSLVDRRARVLVAVVVLAAAIGIAAASFGVVTNAAAHLPQDGASTAAVSPGGPALATLGAVLVATGAVFALVRGGRWPGRAARQATERPSANERSEWDLLSDGEDPT